MTSTERLAMLRANPPSAPLGLATLEMRQIALEHTYSLSEDLERMNQLIQLRDGDPIDEELIYTFNVLNDICGTPDVSYLNE